MYGYVGQDTVLVIMSYDLHMTEGKKKKSKSTYFV